LKDKLVGAIERVLNKRVWVRVLCEINNVRAFVRVPVRSSSCCYCSSIVLKSAPERKRKLHA
jgi:hypothetical protein